MIENATRIRLTDRTHLSALYATPTRRVWLLTVAEQPIALVSHNLQSSRGEGNQHYSVLGAADLSEWSGADGYGIAQVVRDALDLAHSYATQAAAAAAQALAHGAESARPQHRADLEYAIAAAQLLTAEAAAVWNAQPAELPRGAAMPGIATYEWDADPPY